MSVEHVTTALAAVVGFVFGLRYFVPALEAWHYWIVARRDGLEIIAISHARSLKRVRRGQPPC